MPVIRKLLQIFLYVVLGVVSAGAIALLVIFQQWPWWVGVALGAALLSLLFGLLFLKKYFLRARERKFVEQVIAQDQSAIGQSPLHERRHLRELQDKWKASVDLLRQSNLKKHGNPLYVLPWYMVIGESGTGKTTAIKNAKANSPVSEVNAGIAGTRNFDWWFFDEAIILDTAGRYAIPIDHDPDREEWEKFLTLLAKYRKKEPLNGIILTVSADQLLSKPVDDLRENGLNLRKRIDQLMRVCGAKFPVYIMVTKIDQVHGFNQFSRMLPDDRLNQAMGYSSEDPTGAWQDLLDNAHRFVCNRLKDLRLLIIQGTTRIEPGVLLFPDEFEKLHDGLSAFAQGAFQENPYQETPMFMGVYYSSAKQEGQPSSEFIKNFNIACTAPVNSRNGIFLRDFFKKILPGDRNLFRPILEYFKWRRITRRFGLSAWCLFWFSLLGLVSFSYLKNISTIEEIYQSAENRPVFTGERSTDLLIMNGYGKRLDQVRHYNRNWFVPRFGFNHSILVEQQFLDHYVDSFREHLLLPMDLQLQEALRAFDQNTADDTIADYAGHISARMALLKNFLAGGKPVSEEELAEMSTEILHVMYPEMLGEIALLFGRSYYHYLELGSDRQVLEDKLETLHARLVQLLEVRSMNLDWAVSRKLPGVTSIGLDRYWGALKDQQRAASYPVVDAAFTREGKARIEAFVDRLEYLLGQSSRFDIARRAFRHRYENMYMQTWANFAVNFSEGRDFLSSYQQRKSIAKSMATDGNPYFTLLSEMADHLQAIENLPAWAVTLMEIEEIRSTRTGSEKDQPSWMDRLRNKGADVVGRDVVAVASPEAARHREKRLEEALAWEGYVKGLRALAPVGHTPETAYQMAGVFFSGNPSSSDADSPFFEARAQLLSLNTRLEVYGDLSVAEILCGGPLVYLSEFATREAETIIAKKWEETVLASARGIDPHKIPYVVFSRPDGAVWKFLEGPAKPFIGRGKDGFYATTSLGQSISFLNEFFMFLDQGADGTVDVKDMYPVGISTLPIQVNEGADVIPHAVFLNLACDDGPIQLENYNFRASRQFDWRMNQCGDVGLTILMPDTRLRYTYKGDMGFPRFLEDFRHGVRIFTPGDFPMQTDLLQSRGISWIRVSYELKNARPVIDLLKGVPHAVPHTIVKRR